MKTLTKAIAAASLATVSAASFAGTSLTIGAVSDYNFRGVALGDAGAWVSVDYENNGFYAGVWAIDDQGGNTNALNGEDGFEYDTYLGYAGEADGFSYGIGYSRFDYTYTSTFQHEINLSAATAGFGIDIALGVNDVDVDEQDYTVIDLSYSNGPWGILLGMVDNDDFDDADAGESEWKRVEISYSGDFGGVDATATIGRAFDFDVDPDALALLGATETSFASGYIVLDVSKSFDL